MLLHYLKIAFRNLWKYKAQSAVSIGGLTLGFTVFVFCTYWFYYELNSNSQFPDYEDIFFVNSPSVDKNFSHVTLPHEVHDVLKNKYPEIETIEVCQQGEIYVATDEQSTPVLLMGCISYAGYFDLFPPELIIGTYFRQGENKVVLSRSAAMRLFGTTDIVGKAISLTDNYRDYFASAFTVCGVMEDPQPSSSMQFHIMLPFPAQIYKDVTNYSYWTYLKVKKDVDKDGFRNKITGSPVRLSAEREVSIDLVPINRAKYMGDGTSFFKAYNLLIIIAAASVLLLLCALFNHVILSSMRIMLRTGECAMRRTVGSSKAGIGVMFFVELSLVMLFTLVLSLVLFFLCGQAFSQFANIAMPAGVFVKILLMLWILFFAASSITGIYPLWLINRQELGQSIKRNRGYARKTLLTVQLLVGVVFLTSLLEFSRQFRLMTTTDLGFEYNHVLRFHVPLTLRNHGNDLLAGIKSSASVSEALWTTFDIFSSQLSFSSRDGGMFNTEKGDEIVYMNPLPAGTANILGLKMKEGEFFNQDPDGPIKVIVNETLVKQMDLHDVVGKQIKVDGREAEIIGIVQDFHSNPLNTPIYPRFFVCAEQFFMWGQRIPNWCYVKYIPGQEHAARQAITDAISKLGVTVHAADIGTYSEYVESFYHSEKQIIQVFSMIATVCLIICGLGIYAMVNLTAQQRRREIAIRKVVGAETSDIVWMLLKEYLWMVLIACAVALPPTCIIMNGWLQSYAYRVSAGIESILVVIVMALLVTLIVLRKSLVAANSDPAEVVKYE